MTKNNRDEKEPQKTGPGNPPREFRWKKGCPSPNPNGRPPKKVKDRMLKALDPGAHYVILHDQQPLFKNQDGDGDDRTRGEGVIERIYALAMKGDRHLLKEYMKITSEAYALYKECKMDVLDAAIKWIDRYLEQFVEAEKTGKPLPDVLPDPRDIEIEPDGLVRIVGPVTVADKILVDEIVLERDEMLTSLDELHHSEVFDSDELATITGTARRKINKLNRALPPRLQAQWSMEPS